MSNLKNSYTRQARPEFQPFDYHLRTVLQYFRQNGLRKAVYPNASDLNHKVNQYETDKTVLALEARQLLRPHPMGRPYGGFQMTGYIMTYAGEKFLEALRCQNSNEIEMKAMLSLLQEGRAANEEFVPHIAYMTKERTAHLVQTLVQDRSLEATEAGLVKITARGNHMISAYEAHIIQARSPS